MMPGSTKQGGNCFAFPDVCKTPAPPSPSPVPVPYPNTGMVMQASKTSSKVKFCNKAVCTKKSEMSRSQGDEPGTLGGVMSNVNMSKVSYKKCSSKVKVEGQQVAHHLSMTGQNGNNANMPAGSQVSPSQVKVRVMP
ncbi:DUF4150 domain-containing protein [Sediminicurvatus halobius]|uniref:Type VI secretion protein n=1 Tax=Sediminicurvatus halobius TaxID=2182432 RepID=A0A2U2N2I8_9GAMM|nr:DUF4150 domain-containing protein [Spiribacter halobius]PWG63258.1 type VI secretion protein [Spiribacter halobius]UEX76670.1 DUF4150 domain-containing protein [Spiribacter halobius]